MDTLNNFHINEYASISSYEIDSTSIKENSLQANVSLTVAATLLSLTSASQVKANTFDFNVPKEYITQSLDQTVSLVNEINTYTELSANNTPLYIDKYNIIEEIVSFKSLENSWDGYGAKPLGIKCATNAIKLIEAFDNRAIGKITQYFPNPHGTISFEWENDCDEIIAVEIGKDNFSYFVSLNNIDSKYYNNQNFNIENIEMLKEFISAI